MSTVYKVTDIKHWPADAKHPWRNDWIPARPLTYPRLRNRIRAAFGVLTGRYDALDWEDREVEQ